MMNTVISTVELRHQQDVALARQRARQIADLLGFNRSELTRIATAVSEIARNAFEYGGGGRAQFVVEEDPAPLFTIIIEDKGPGIENLTAVLAGQYQSTTGMGLGIIGARRLMDRFEIRSTAGAGSTVRMSKEISPGAEKLTGAAIGRLAEELARHAPESPFEEVQQQNQELLQSLEEIGRLNQELETTNRGVVALYAELDEHTNYLRRANDLKTSFLSNMSHEFRTPLNAIEGLSRLLLEHADGPLTSEQEKQVKLIRGAAGDLSELVNELLDLAKVEAGKLNVQVDHFEIGVLFDSLRGMLRPLLAHNTAVELHFHADAQLPELETDERKVAQILRNFISNALKFTERGAVRVLAECGANNTVIFSVADPGIGIAPEDHERIFEEFVQVEGPHQRRLKGTGLGLSLCRKLAGLLQGDVAVTSEPGRGSIFYLTIPCVYAETGRTAIVSSGTLPGVEGRSIDAGRIPILMVEDNRETLFLYEKYLEHSPYQMVPASSLHDARAALFHYRPAVIVLDILLQKENTWEFLSEVKADPRTNHIPVLVITVVDNERKALALGADAFGAKPVDRMWLLDTLKSLTQSERVAQG